MHSFVKMVQAVDQRTELPSENVHFFLQDTKMLRLQNAKQEQLDRKKFFAGDSAITYSSMLGLGNVLW